MSASTVIDRYQPDQTYLWNYEHAPKPNPQPVAEVPGEWAYCGLPVDSPLGMPAGPLLNGKWLLYYAQLGFDVLTYKTVRSIPRDCYGLPNLQPVEIGSMTGEETDVETSGEMKGSWAVSFGMPSTSPEIWRADIEWTRDQLPAGKVLSVSVVGSVQPDWSLDDLADDYAQCAKWAVESGADSLKPTSPARMFPLAMGSSSSNRMQPRWSANGFGMQLVVCLLSSKLVA
jgi:dihydroorotate dehydrogenase (NAD+) catalytic subunit